MAACRQLIEDGRPESALPHLVELAKDEALRPRAEQLIRRARGDIKRRAAPPATGPAAPRVEALLDVDPRRLRILNRASSPPEARLKACAHLVERGEVGLALAHLADLLDVPELKADVDMLITQCRRMRELRSHVQRGRGWPEKARLGEGYAAIPAGSDTTVLCFTGRGALFGISSYFMRGLLDYHNVNTVYLFDWRELGYLGGIGGLGGNIEEASEGLARICRDFGTRRLVTFGISLGGYGAIRFGLTLRADATLVLGPRLRSVLGGRHLSVIRETLGAPVDPAGIDVRSLYAAAPDPPPTWIVYGADNPTDELCAAHMRGLKGIVEEPIPGVAEHTILRHLALAGEFTPLFSRFLQAAGPGRWASPLVEA